MIRVGLIGPGKVGRSIVQALPRDRYLLGPVLGKGPSAAKRLVHDLRDGKAVRSAEAFGDCEAILITIPEAEVSAVIDGLIQAGHEWEGKCVLHSCRESPSAFLQLEKLGASVASCYPMYAFHRPRAELRGVHFVLSGDAPAVRLGRAMVQSIGGHGHVISRQLKAQASIAFSIASDVMTGIFEISVRRLMAAGLSRRRAVDAVSPVVMTTLEDCRRSGARTTRFPAADAGLIERLIEACDREDPGDAALYRTAMGLAMDSLEVDDAHADPVPAPGRRSPRRSVAAD